MVMRTAACLYTVVLLIMLPVPASFLGAPPLWVTPLTPKTSRKLGSQIDYISPGWPADSVSGDAGFAPVIFTGRPSSNRG
jgi:hypothetical protein